MPNTPLRKLTPPGKSANISSTYSINNQEDEDTSPGSPTLMLAQKFFVVFDSMNLEDQKLIIALVEAFPNVSMPEKKMIVAAVEKMAGL